MTTESVQYPCPKFKRIERLAECINGHVKGSQHVIDLKDNCTVEETKQKLDNRLAKIEVARLDLQEKLSKILDDHCRDCKNHGCKYFNQEWLFFLCEVSFRDRQ